MIHQVFLLALPLASAAWFDYVGPYALQPMGHHVLDSPWAAPRYLHDEFGRALSRLSSRGEVRGLVRGLVDELEAAMARLDRLEGQVKVSRDDEGGLSVAVEGMAPGVEVEVDENVLKVSGTSTDGKTAIRRALGLPRRVANTAFISAMVDERGMLLVKVPRDALEPEPARVHARIDVKQHKTLDAPADGPPAAAEGEQKKSGWLGK